MDKPLFISEADKQRILHVRELLKKNAPIVYQLYKSYKLNKEHERLEVREQQSIK